MDGDDLWSAAVTGDQDYPTNQPMKKQSLPSHNYYSSNNYDDQEYGNATRDYYFSDRPKMYSGKTNYEEGQYAYGDAQNDASSKRQTYIPPLKRQNQTTTEQLASKKYFSDKRSKLNTNLRGSSGPGPRFQPPINQPVSDPIVKPNIANPQLNKAPIRQSFGGPPLVDRNVQTLQKGAYVGSKQSHIHPSLRKDGILLGASHEDKVLYYNTRADSGTDVSKSAEAESESFDDYHRYHYVRKVPNEKGNTSFKKDFKEGPGDNMVGIMEKERAYHVVQEKIQEFYQEKLKENENGRKEGYTSKQFVGDFDRNADRFDDRDHGNVRRFEGDVQQKNARGDWYGDEYAERNDGYGRDGDVDGGGGGGWYEGKSEKDRRYGERDDNEGWRHDGREGYEDQRYGEKGKDDRRYGGEGYKDHRYGEKGNDGHRYGQEGYDDHRYGEEGYDDHRFSEQGYDDRRYGEGGYDGRRYGEGGNDDRRYGEGGNDGRRYGETGNDERRYGGGDWNDERYGDRGWKDDERYGHQEWDERYEGKTCESEKYGKKGCNRGLRNWENDEQHANIGGQNRDWYDRGDIDTFGDREASQHSRFDDRHFEREDRFDDREHERENVNTQRTGRYEDTAEETKTYYYVPGERDEPVERERYPVKGNRNRNVQYPVKGKRNTYGDNDNFKSSDSYEWDGPMKSKPPVIKENYTSKMDVAGAKKTSSSNTKEKHEGKKADKEDIKKMLMDAADKSVQDFRKQRMAGGAPTSMGNVRVVCPGNPIFRYIVPLGNQSNTFPPNNMMINAAASSAVTDKNSKNTTTTVSNPISSTGGIMRGPTGNPLFPVSIPPPNAVIRPLNPLINHAVNHMNPGLRMVPPLQIVPGGIPNMPFIVRYNTMPAPVLRHPLLSNVTIPPPNEPTFLTNPTISQNIVPNNVLNMAPPENPPKVDTDNDKLLDPSKPKPLMSVNPYESSNPKPLMSIPVPNNNTPQPIIINLRPGILPDPVETEESKKERNRLLQSALKQIDARKPTSESNKSKKFKVNPKKPWFDHECHVLHKKRLRKLARLKKARNQKNEKDIEELKQIIREINREYVPLLRERKATYVNELETKGEIELLCEMTVTSLVDRVVQIRKIERREKERLAEEGKLLENREETTVIVIDDDQEEIEDEQEEDDEGDAGSSKQTSNDNNETEVIEIIGDDVVETN